MPAPSLKATCTKACIKNIRSITNVGCLTYRQIRDVLIRVDSPTQLLEIERNSPQIAGEDAEIWKAFIAKHIPDWETKNYVPKDPRKWHKVYTKYKKEQDEKIWRDKEILRESLAGIKKKKDGMVIEIVDAKKLPKLPKDSRMIGNAGILNGGKRGALFKKDTPSTLSWTAGSKTKITDGKSVLTRVRREAKEITLRSKLARPAHQTLGQVKRAPDGMVNEYRRAAEPPLKILARRNIVGKLPAAAPSLEDRESRLRALTMRQPAVPSGATMIGSSDEEDSADDLPDELPKMSSQSSLYTQSSTSQPQSSISSRPTPSASRPTLPSSDRPVSKPPSSQPSLPSSRPILKPSQPSSSGPRPSEVISSMISKPKPLPRPFNSPPAPQRTSSPGFRRSASPSARSMPPIPRKRPEVDIFNRKVKKPRLA